MDSVKFVLKGKKLNYLEADEKPVIRISADAYNALIDMANETGMSISSVASQAIAYASKNVVYERSDE